jgi:hypothetical protein
MCARISPAGEGQGEGERNALFQTPRCKGAHATGGPRPVPGRSRLAVRRSSSNLHDPLHAEVLRAGTARAPSRQTQDTALGVNSNGVPSFSPALPDGIGRR